MEIRKLKPWNWFEGESDKSWTSGRAVTPWYSPAPSLSQLRKDIDRMFEDVFQTGPSRRFDALPTAVQEHIMLRPNVNITSTEKEYRITVEVPGVEEKDIRIETTPDMLSIRGEKRHERKEDYGDSHCIECAYGAFERMLSLPEDAEADKVNAAFKNGVVHIAMPRRKKAKLSARQVPIDHAA